MRLIAATLALFAVACGAPADPPPEAPEPAELAGQTVRYQKRSGLCSDGDFELPAWDVPIWLTAQPWQCETVTSEPGLLHLACYKKDPVTPRFEVVHTLRRVGPRVVGEAVFFGAECEGEYGTDIGGDLSTP